MMIEGILKTFEELESQFTVKKMFFELSAREIAVGGKQQRQGKFNTLRFIFLSFKEVFSFEHIQKESFNSSFRTDVQAVSGNIQKTGKGSLSRNLVYISLISIAMSAFVIGLIALFRLIF